MSQKQVWVDEDQHESLRGLAESGYAGVDSIAGQNRLAVRLFLEIVDKVVRPVSEMILSETEIPAEALVVRVDKIVITTGANRDLNGDGRGDGAFALDLEDPILALALPVVKGEEGG